MKLGIIDDHVTLISTEAGQLTAQTILNAKTVFEAIAHQETWQLATPVKLDHQSLQMPIPLPEQVFAVGMNYTDHSHEIKVALPTVPSIFTKFQTSLTGPDVTVKRHGEQTDWETELVIVIGKGGRDITKDDAWQHVAGYMVGQDLSDRFVQLENPDDPQFSMGKSFEKYGPIGPWLTTPDEITDITALEITTRVDGEIRQQAHLRDMIFDTADLISYLSSITELKPGNIIFTGTPSGVGLGRTPQLFLHPGETLVSEIEQLGSLTIRITD